MILTVDIIIEKYMELGLAGASRTDKIKDELRSMSRTDLISYYLALFGSHQRALPMFDVVSEEAPDVFWNVIIENWSACDGLWFFGRHLLYLMRLRKVQCSPAPLMSNDDRAFFDSLPDRVKVHRGCARRRVRGLPWTTDFEQAAYFARGGRFPRQRDAVIATATVAKADIFFVSASRKESEVVLDPYAITRPRLTANIPL